PFGMRKGVLSRLPIHLYAFSDGLFIIDAPPAPSGLIGSKVLEIGGRDVSGLASAIRPYLSRETDALLAFEVPFALTLPDLLGAVGADTQGTDIRIKLRQEGRTFTAALAKMDGPLDPDKLPLKLIPPKGIMSPPPDYLARVKDNFWLKQVDRDTLYVQINQCQ